MQNHILDYLDETVRRVPQKLAFGGVQDEDGLTFFQLNEASRSVGSFVCAGNVPGTGGGFYEPSSQSRGGVSRRAAGRVFLRAG